MEKNNKSEIEELFSSYIDGELSERQKMEVKRLIDNNPELESQLKMLVRQKELLGAMPVDQAPEGMLSDVRSRLERQLILEPSRLREEDSAGARHLLMRNLVSVAALFLLLGIMGLVVYNIMVPVDNGSGEGQGSDVLSRDVVEEIEMMRREGSPSTVAREVKQERKILYARLDLSSREWISINAFLEKAMYNNNLVECTVPKHQPTMSTYRLSCSRQKVVELVDDLTQVWDKCNNKDFTIYSSDDFDSGNSFTISEVPLAYISDIVSMPSDDPVLFAKRYVRARPDDKGIEDDGWRLEDIRPVKPMLTGPEDKEEGGQEGDADSEREEVELTIVVKGVE